MRIQILILILMCFSSCRFFESSSHSSNIATEFLKYYLLNTITVSNNNPTDTDSDPNQTRTNVNQFARTGQVTLVFNGRIWGMGGTLSNFGISYEQAWNDIFSSFDGINWETIIREAPWGRRTMHGGVVFNNKMWILGGMNCRYDVLYPFEDVWYSSDGINWTCAGIAPWGKRYNHAVVVLKDRLYVIGGQLTPEIYYNDVWSTADGFTWRQETSSGFPLSDGSTTINLSGTAAVSYADRIWLVGGQSFIGVNDKYFDPTEVKYHAEVWSSTDGVNWSNETNGGDKVSIIPRSQARLVVHNNTLWLSGGKYELIKDGIDQKKTHSDNGIYYMDTSSGLSKAPWVQTNYPLDKVFETYVQADEIKMFDDGYLYYLNGLSMEFLRYGMFGLSQHSFISFNGNLMLFWGEGDAIFNYKPDEYGYTSACLWRGFFMNMYCSSDGFTWKILNDKLSLHSMTAPVYEWCTNYGHNDEVIFHTMTP